MPLFVKCRCRRGRGEEREDGGGRRVGGEGRRRSRRKKRRRREEQIQGGSRGRGEKISAPAIGGFNPACFDAHS